MYIYVWDTVLSRTSNTASFCWTNKEIYVISYTDLFSKDFWPEFFATGCIKQGSNWLKSLLKQASFQTGHHSSSYGKLVRFTADTPHLWGSVLLYLNVCVCIYKTHHVHPALTVLANELFVRSNVVLHLNELSWLEIPLSNCPSDFIRVCFPHVNCYFKFSM